MKVIRTIIWLLPIAGVRLAAIVLVGGMATASGAPQEAVVTALACALAILPYCLSRSLSEIMDTWQPSSFIEHMKPPQMRPRKIKKSRSWLD